MSGVRMPAVPVTIAGVHVGFARVHEDGTLTLKVDPDHPGSGMVKELFQRLKVGLTTGLNIVPDKPTAAVPTDQTVVLPRARTWEDFRKSGLLWLINRVAFHPRGRALAFVYDDKNEVVGWQLMGDGKEIWAFDLEEEKPLFLAAEKTLRVDTE